MKKNLLRATAVALSILTFAATLPVGALYRGVLGDVYYVSSAQLGAGVDYTEYRSVTDGLNERAYVFEYRAGEGAFPIVSFGDKLTGSSKVNNLAKDEAKKENNVIGGVNGDFFSIQTGIPMGTAIRDGRLLTDDDNNNAVGFTYDGETIFGNPEITFTVSHTYQKPEKDTEIIKEMMDSETEEDSSDEANTEFADESEAEENEESSDSIIEAEETEETEEGSDNDEESLEELGDAETYTEIIDGIEYITEELPVSYFNKYPTEWGAYLLDDMFSDSTRSKKDSLEIIIRLDDKEAYAKIGEALTGEIIEINSMSTDTKLSKGELVISVCETSSYRSAYDNIALGNKVTITFDAAEGWENVESAIGGSDVFIKDGIIDESVINDSHEKIANPRTAVGVRPDGTVLIFAADGRQDISYGFRMISLAKTLLSFGCIYALNLDGGGSTTAVVKLPGEDETKVVSSPSDTAARSVSNALLLVDNTQSDNIPRYIIPDNASPIILAGESYTFDDLKFCDRSLTEVVFSEDSNENQEIIDGLMENLEIRLDKSRLYYYRDLEMPDLGTISEDGKMYTADGESGEIPLLLTSEYGDYNVSGRALLFVANSPDEIVARLERNIFAGTEKFDISFESYYMSNRVPSSVKQVEFELTDDIIITAHEGKTEDALAWCSVGYIDGSGAFVPYTNADGSAILTLSLNGKEAVSCRIIVGNGILPIVEETELYYEFPAIDKETSDSEQAEELHEDTDSDVTSEEMMSSESTDSQADTEETDTAEDFYDETEDTSEETEEALSEDIKIHTDDIVIEQEFDLYGVKSLDLYTTETELAIYAVIQSGDDEIHIDYVLQNQPDNDGIFHYRADIGGIGDSLISPLNIDAGENSEKAGSLKIQNISVAFSDTEAVFYDTYNHWARENINTLYRMQIVGGEESGGKLIFSPERSLSRAEFAVMISRALEYDTEEYTVDPDFADLDEIPAWALPHIRAVSENGLMNGKLMNDGSLKFDYSGKITRQEIMQVIGNLIKSLDEASSEDQVFEEIFEDETEDKQSGTGFADISQVADWAYENVILTLDSKIITGYNDNTIRPLNNVTRAEAATIILRTVNSVDLQK